MANTTNLVTAGKPNTSGAIWWAAAGSTLPTDANTALDAAFKCLGYVSEDGMTNSNSKETDNIKAWGGNIVLNVQTGYSDTFQFTLIETLNEDVLKSVYGSSNVSGALATGLTVHANADELAASVYVVELAQRDGCVHRIVIPNAYLTEVGDITYKDDEVVGFPITITALPGGFASPDQKDTHKEYILRT